MPITRPSGNTTVITPNNSGGTPRPVILFSGAVVNSDLDEAGNGITRDGSTGIYKLDGDVYFTNTCDLSGFGNVTLDISDKDFYIHPDAPDTTFRNVVLRMTGNRRVGDRFVFKEGSQYNAIGGGFIHAAIDRPDSGDRRYLSVLAAGNINNVQLRAEDYSLQEIDALTFLQSGEYSGVVGIRVKRVSADNGTTRLLLHDCNFNSSVLESGTQIGCYHNANAMLNDCDFLRYNGAAVDSTNAQWLDTYSTATDQAQYIYLMGSTAPLLKTTWNNQDRNNLTRVHAGSLKYFQVFLEGSPVSDFSYRVFSRKTTETTPTARRAVPTLTTNEMLHTVGSSPSPDNGKINLAIIKSLVTRINSVFTREEFTGIILKIRNPKIIFLNYAISNSQAIISQGRPDNAVPLVIQPDPHANFDEISAVNILIINTEISFDFSTRTATATSNRTWTPAKLYAYYRFILSEPDNFTHEQEWTFDGNVLDLGAWSLTFGNANTLNLTPNKGREIRATQGQITPGTNLTNNGVTLIDSDGVSVRITSNVAGTRAIITHGSTTLYHDLPFGGLLPLNTEVGITAKAPGYIFQTYAINTATDRSLDIRLPKDPSIDLETMFTTAEINAIALNSAAQGTLTFEVGEIQLGGQRQKSKRILDALLSTNAGLKFLADYTDELSGSPMSGSPLLWESYRVRMDVDNNDMDGKINFIKTATETQRCRLGIPVFTPAGDVYYAPRRAGHGAVIFDNQVISDVDPKQISDEVKESIERENGLLHSLSNTMQTEFDNIRLGFFELDSISNNNYVNGFVGEPDDIIMIRGVLHNSVTATVGDIISKYNGQVKRVGDVSRHIYASFLADGEILSVCNYNEDGSQVMFLDNSSLGMRLKQVSRDGLISESITHSTNDSLFAYVRGDEVIVIRTINGKLTIAVGDKTNNITGITQHWDFTAIDLPSTERPSMIIFEGRIHILISGRLHLFDFTTDSSDEINSITFYRSYAGYEENSIFCELQKALWLYKEGTFTPLNFNYNEIRTEWDKFGDAVRQAEIENIETPTVQVDLTETNSKIDAVKTVVDTLPTTVTPAADFTATNSKIDAVKTVVDALPTAATPATDLTGIARTADVTAAHSTTNGKIDAVKTVVDALPTTVTPATDLTNTNSKIDAANTILDKLNFNSNDDIKATLDGEEVTTDSTSRIASKATGYATPADVTTARDVISNSITSARDVINTKVDTVKTVADDIEAQTDKMQFTNTNDIKSTLDGEEVTTDDASRLASKATGFATPANLLAAQAALRAQIDQNETKLNVIKTTIDLIKTETDKIQTIDDNVDTTISQTTAAAISSAVETAFLDDDDGRAFLQQILDKVEQAIEDESLTENALATAIRREVWQHVLNPDDPESEQVQAQQGLNAARQKINRLDTDLPTERILLIDLAKAALDWLVKLGRADMRVDQDDDDGEHLVLYDSTTNEILLTFKHSEGKDSSDWSGGRRIINE